MLVACLLCLDWSVGQGEEGGRPLLQRLPIGGLPVKLRLSPLWLRQTCLICIEDECCLGAASFSLLQAILTVQVLPY